MATATSVFMVLTFGGNGYASSIATSIRLSTFSSVRSTARAGPRGWHAVRSEPSLERPRIMIGASADHGGARPHDAQTGALLLSAGPAGAAQQLSGLHPGLCRCTAGDRTDRL